MESQKIETMDSESLIREILENSKESIKTNLQEQIKKSIIDNLSWTLREEISKHVNEFVKNEMQEDIKAALIEHKPIILTSLKEAFTKIGAAVAQSMYETAAKNFSVGSYRTNDIIKKILE